MQDRALLARFLGQLSDGERPLTPVQEAAVSRIARLDAKLAAPAYWILDRRGLVLEEEAEPPAAMTTASADDRRVSRILRDL
jgi:hypothetical protein